MTNGEMAGDAQEKAAAAGQRPLFSLTVRGGSLDLWPDRIMFGSASYPQTELVQAALVSYPADSPGSVSLGVLLRTRDGRAPLFIPEDSTEAQRFLNMIYGRRPDLRGASPRFPSSYPPYYAGYPTHTPYSSGILQSERMWALLSHLSVFFIPLWFPLIVWLVTQQTMPYASRQAKQAFFFHLMVVGVMLLLVLPVGAVFVFSTFGSIAASPDSSVVSPFPPSFFLGFVGVWLVAMLLSITNVAFGIYGAVQAYQGKPFHYPLLGRM